MSSPTKPAADGDEQILEALVGHRRAREHHVAQVREAHAVERFLAVPAGGIEERRIGAVWEQRTAEPTLSETAHHQSLVREPDEAIVDRGVQVAPGALEMQQVFELVDRLAVQVPRAPSPRCRRRVERRADARRRGPARGWPRPA